MYNSTKGVVTLLSFKIFHHFHNILFAAVIPPNFNSSLCIPVFVIRLLIYIQKIVTLMLEIDIMVYM